MKSERLELFKDFVYRVASQSRLTGSDGIKKAHRLIEGFFEYAGCKYEKEVFRIKKLLPESAWLELDGKKIVAVPFAGSPSTRIEAFVKRNYIEGDIALIPDATEWDIIKAKEKGAVAVICYRSQMVADAYVHGSYTRAGIPVVSVSREHVRYIEDAKVLLVVNSEEKILQGTNYMVEIGKGPIIYLIAHVDTTADTYGAINSAVGFMLLLFIYEELRRTYSSPCRVRFLLTDAREMGMEGVKHHLTKGLKHVFYCINLEGLGWHNPCVIYKDADGYNGEAINHKFYRHLKDMKLDLDFCEAPDRDGEHVFFKKAGVQTLYLSSYPLTIKHTLYDCYDAISWDHVLMWYEVILSFLRRFHRL